MQVLDVMLTRCFRLMSQNHLLLIVKHLIIVLIEIEKGWLANMEHFFLLI